jgi:maltose phosphorylase
LDITEVGAIKYDIKPLNFDAKLKITPYLDGGIRNEDSNYDELFWKVLDVKASKNEGYILSKTLKTNFYVTTGMKLNFALNNKKITILSKSKLKDKKVKISYLIDVNKSDNLTIYKFGGYVHSMNVDKEDLYKTQQNILEKASKIGFETLLENQKLAWQKIWETSDIEIKGDVKAQQAIRFNIFQLNQTYTGIDSRLNIGPKGFTGEKYGGSTYWDTEAYCIPFYMSTKDKKVARNLLMYRYNQLDKAIENAAKLGFNSGAALYPMVTMNGEECHNEWEITFEEIHRNGAMIYAIYNYENYTGDLDYVTKYGLEVIIAVARFWQQRVNFSEAKQKYVMLGVTGPNEYENNVNNNFYTNYLAKWCMEYAAEKVNFVKEEFLADFNRIAKKTNLTAHEVKNWKKVASEMHFPYSDKLNVYLQQDGFLDKDKVTVADLSKSDRPINQKWSWDRILRSPYIKQADVLQGLYLFENQFTNKELVNHFNYYEPLTVHESSLSPCVHSILASKINYDEKAYEMYLRTARLDLDDYNNEVHEGLHITSMAGTWMAIVQGFGGMRNFDNKLVFNPKIPKEWNSYSFKINYRGNTLQVTVNQKETVINNLSENSIEIELNDKKITV